MILKEAPVKSQSKVVGTAQFEVFESVQEAVDTLGPAAVLDLINSQNKTNKQNAIRAAKTGKPSEKRILDEAYLLIKGEEFMLCQGDQAKIQELIESKKAIVRARLEAERALEPQPEDEEEAND